MHIVLHGDGVSSILRQGRKNSCFAYLHVYLKQDQVNNADSAIIFLINHWSVILVRMVKLVQDVQIVQVVQVVQVV